MNKKVLELVIGVSMLGLVGCGSDLEEVAQESIDWLNAEFVEDEHVTLVKNGTNNNYPDVTWGKAFDNFFKAPSWRYFVGTQQAPDEDGDGVSDGEEQDVEVVEFTGYCTYQGVEVEALLQFTLNMEESTFEPTYLSFNDVPQNNLTMYALVEKVLSEASGVTETETLADDTSENNGDVSSDITQDEPSATESAEEETETNEDHSAEFVGDWADTISQRCYMTIECSDGINYIIDINWSSSAWENTNWVFYGTYDEEEGGILYSGSEIFTVYNDDGTVDETYIYEDGKGILYIGQNGKLYWEDWEENQGENCVFEKMDM